jgi:hypothetical protein
MFYKFVCLFLVGKKYFQFFIFGQNLSEKKFKNLEN